MPAINGFELRVFLERVHEDSDVRLKVCPVFLVLLYLILRLAERLVELLDVLLRMQELAVICELFEIFRNGLVELLSFPNQDFLYREKVPVLPDGLQQVVEEVVELETQVVADEYYVVSQLNLVLRDALGYLLPDQILASADLAQGLLDLGLQGL